MSPKQKKTFVLKDIYMATVNPFTVQVALHNAGGYSEAVTIEPFPPAEPEGLDVIMDQMVLLRYDCLRVHVVSSNVIVKC